MTTEASEHVEGFEGEEQVSVGEVHDSEYQGLGVVYIDSKKCLKCKILLGDEIGRKTFKCTYEEGNTNCPAARYQIIIGMDVEQAVSDIVESVQKSDLDSVIQILSDVKTKDPALVDDFMRELCDRLGVEIEEDAEADEESDDVDSEIEEDDDADAEPAEDEVDDDDEEDD